MNARRLGVSTICAMFSRVRSKTSGIVVFVEEADDLLLEGALLGREIEVHAAGLYERSARTSGRLGYGRRSGSGDPVVRAGADRECWERHADGSAPSARRSSHRGDRRAGGVGVSAAARCLFADLPVSRHRPRRPAERHGRGAGLGAHGAHHHRMPVRDDRRDDLRLLDAGPRVHRQYRALVPSPVRRLIAGSSSTVDCAVTRARSRWPTTRRSRLTRHLVRSRSADPPQAEGVARHRPARPPARHRRRLRFRRRCVRRPAGVSRERSFTCAFETDHAVGASQDGTFTAKTFAVEREFVTFDINGKSGPSTVPRRPRLA